MKKLFETDVTIGTDVVQGAYELRTVLAEVTQDEERKDMLVKLIWGTLQDLHRKMPEGITSAELLMVADIIGDWALKDLADANCIEESLLQQSWALALAMRYELLPTPSAAELTAAQRVYGEKPS